MQQADGKRQRLREKLKRIKARISIRDYLERFGDAYEPNASGKCRCPFHHDVNPSAKIHGQQPKEYLRCYVCNESWDILDIVQETMKCPKSAALSFLEMWAGDDLDQQKVEERAANEKAICLKMLDRIDDKINIMEVTHHEQMGNIGHYIMCSAPSKVNTGAYALWARWASSLIRSIKRQIFQRDERRTEEYLD